MDISFKKFFIEDAPATPDAGGISAPGALPGAGGPPPMPMGGGAGGPPPMPMGGGMGGMGGTSGGAGGAGAAPTKLKAYNVWDVIERVLDEEGSNKA